MNEGRVPAFLRFPLNMHPISPLPVYFGATLESGTLQYAERTEKFFVFIVLTWRSENVMRCKRRREITDIIKGMKGSTCWCFLGKNKIVQLASTLVSHLPLLTPLCLSSSRLEF